MARVLMLGQSGHGVSGMRSMFDKKAKDHADSQLDNPFSDWKGAGSNPKRLSKDDENYGRPLPGSKSEKRAQAAQQHIMMEIKYCVDMIWDCAEWRSPDGRGAITFGKLFNIYIAISDKVVGTLLRARKHGYVTFEGEMLYQRRDDDKVIEHTRPYNTIRARMGQKPLLTGGGAVEPWNTEDLPITRRNSVDTNTQQLTDKTPRRNSMPPSMTLNGSLQSKKKSKEENPEVVPGIIINCEDSASATIVVTPEAGNKLNESPKREFLLPSSAGSLSPRRARSLTPCRMNSMDELDSIEEDPVDDMVKELEKRLTDLSNVDIKEGGAT